MSDIGQTVSNLLQINANASQIETRWLRDAVIAISVLARPVGIGLCGMALSAPGFAMACRAMRGPLTEWDFAVITVIAAAFGVVAGLRSWDKSTAVKTGGQS